MNGESKNHPDISETESDTVSKLFQYYGKETVFENLNAVAGTIITALTKDGGAALAAAAAGNYRAGLGFWTNTMYLLLIKVVAIAAVAVLTALWVKKAAKKYPPPQPQIIVVGSAAPPDVFGKAYEDKDEGVFGSDYEDKKDEKDESDPFGGY